MPFTLIKDVCAVTSICEEDACWIDQYLAEVKRLDVSFVVNFDRCTALTKRKLGGHPNFAGSLSQDDPAIEFDETHKQGILDFAKQIGFAWALAWDIDETWAKNAPGHFDTAINAGADYVNCKWVNTWNSAGLIRTDGPFSSGHRDKLYSLRAGRWIYTNRVVNGPKLHLPNRQRKIPMAGNELKYRDLVCIHWGMMTRELREQHKARWDRIYSAAVGNNPYGFWQYALDEETYPPVTAENTYV